MGFRLLESFVRSDPSSLFDIAGASTLALLFCVVLQCHPLHPGIFNGAVFMTESLPVCMSHRASDCCLAVFLDNLHATRTFVACERVPEYLFRDVPWSHPVASSFVAHTPQLSCNSLFYSATTASPKRRGCQVLRKIVPSVSHAPAAPKLFSCSCIISSLILFRIVLDQGIEGDNSSSLLQGDQREGRTDISDPLIFCRGDILYASFWKGRQRKKETNVPAVTGLLGFCSRAYIPDRRQRGCHAAT